MNTEISQKLQDISYYFNLGVIRDYKRAGGKNRNYYISTNKGQYFIKMLTSEEKENIEKEVAYLNTLKEHQFPIAAFIKASSNSYVYNDGAYLAVALHKLEGAEPEVNENICRVIGINLAKLSLITIENLPSKQHWLESHYLPKSIDIAKKKFGESALQQTLKEYTLLQHFKPEAFPQSIVHGDLDPSNCLFIGEILSALLDWQESGIGASILDFGMTVLGFCFVKETTPVFTVKFHPDFYGSLFDGYSQVRLFSPHEQEYIETAVKYAGLTMQAWFMLHWDTYFSGQVFEEHKLPYFQYGLHSWKLTSCAS